MSAERVARLLGVFFFLGIFLASAFAAASQPSMAEARQAYFSARDGRKDPGEAIAVVDAYLQSDKGNPLAQVYKGSLRAMQAGKAYMPWQKMRYLAEGLDLLDGGMARLNSQEQKVDPDSKLEALVISGITNASVPKSYARTAKARRDLATAIGMQEFERLSQATRASIYAWMSVLYREEEPSESRRYLAQARGLDQRVADEIGAKP